MSVIKSADSVSELTIDPTSNAARVSAYGKVVISKLVTYSGVKRSFRASVSNTITTHNTANSPQISIEGTALRKITVQSFSFGGFSQTSVGYLAFSLIRLQSLIAINTGNSVTQVPMDASGAESLRDSNSGAGNAVVLGTGSATYARTFSAAPASTPAIFPMVTRRYLMQATTAAAGGIPDFVHIDLKSELSETGGVVLRGHTQAFGLSTATTATVTYSASFEWTEEDY
jgi:hypothetical protein